MALVSSLDQAPPAGLTSGQTTAAALALIVAFAAVGFLAGHVAGPVLATAPIEDVHGVPVGVQHSAAGALAAADNYVALEQQTVERHPARFAALVATVYAASIRNATLRAAQVDRGGDAPGIALWARGGQSYTTIGAHRLDYYRGGLAGVTTWAGQVYWGPTQPPGQVWALGRTTLHWAGGRWRVSAMQTVPEPAPSAAQMPQAAPGDDSLAVFESLLSGFTAVSYGPAGG